RLKHHVHILEMNGEAIGKRQQEETRRKRIRAQHSATGYGPASLCREKAAPVRKALEKWKTKPRFPFPPRFPSFQNQMPQAGFAPLRRLHTPRGILSLRRMGKLSRCVTSPRNVCHLCAAELTSPHDMMPPP